MSRRKSPRMVSDPREMAGLVLDTPGLVDKLAESLAGTAARNGYRVAVRGDVLRCLVELADQWPHGDGWAIDNDGEVYRYTRADGGQ